MKNRWMLGGGMGLALAVLSSSVAGAIPWFEANDFVAQADAQVVNKRWVGGVQKCDVLVLGGFVNSGREVVHLIEPGFEVLYDYTVYNLRTTQIVAQGRLNTIPPTVINTEVRPHDDVFYAGGTIELDGGDSYSISVVAHNGKQVIGVAHSILTLI